MESNHPKNYPPIPPESEASTPPMGTKPPSTPHPAMGVLSIILGVRGRKGQEVSNAGTWGLRAKSFVPSDVRVAPDIVQGGWVLFLRDSDCIGGLWAPLFLFFTLRELPLFPVSLCKQITCIGTYYIVCTYLYIYKSYLFPLETHYFVPTHL